MESPILHINPEEIKDVPSLRAALYQSLNFIETLLGQINELQKQIQELKEEIKRLKGEKGQPVILPNTKRDISSAKQAVSNKQWHKGAKKNHISIDNHIVCQIDKEVLPPDAVFKGYEKVVSQDIIFKRDNTEYSQELWYCASQKKTYRAPLPSSYSGYFGSNLKAMCIMMYYAMDVTRNKLLSFFHSMGIEISTGSLENILKENAPSWIEEKRDLLKTGLGSAYLQTDSTGARVNGQNYRTHVFVSECFAVYSTQPGKSRLDILGALQGQPQEGLQLQNNLIAQEFLEHYNISLRDRKQISEVFRQKSVMGIDEFERLITEQVPKLRRKPTSYKWVIESLAFGYYFEQTQYPAPSVFISDDAKEYVLLSPYRMLCWIHDARYYNVSST